MVVALSCFITEIVGPFKDLLLDHRWCSEFQMASALHSKVAG